VGKTNTKCQDVTLNKSNPEIADRYNPKSPLVDVHLRGTVGWRSDALERLPRPSAFSILFFILAGIGHSTKWV
jgi:hypothetical protein